MRIIQLLILNLQRYFLVRAMKKEKITLEEYRVKSRALRVRQINLTK
jgi:hypothetical protein